MHRSPLQQAEYDNNVAESNAKYWKEEKEKTLLRYNAALAKANKCKCNRCPDCGKEKS